MSTSAEISDRGRRLWTPAADVHSRTDVGLAASLAAIGVGLATVALLGPFGTAVIDYHVTETLRNQTIGLDAVSLLFVAPLALLAALLVLRGHVAGALIALGIGAYTAYMLVQYMLGPEYERLPGNNELLFPLYVVLFALGWIAVVAAWNSIDFDRLPRRPRCDRLLGRIVLPLLGFLAFFRYLPALADWMSSTPEDEGYLAGPTFSWAIAMLDLGVFLPVTVATCLGLARGAPWAQKALYTVVGWFGLVGPAVAAMAIKMYVNDDPLASGGNTIFMTVLGVAFLTLAVFVYWPFLRGRAASRVVAGEGGRSVSLHAPLAGRARLAVIAIAGVTSVGALFGGYGLLSDAEGLGVKESWLDGTPFPDYRIPGLVLLVVVGGGMLLTAASALLRSRFAGLAALAMGLALLVWGAVETATIGYRGGAQLLLLAVFVVAPALPLIKIGWDSSRASLVGRTLVAR